MLKQTQLLAASLGGDSTLTWMGSEIGQIESAELPGAVNNYKHMSLSYDSADNKGLKFKHLDMFNLCLNRTAAALKWLADSTHTILAQDEEAKVLAYVRGGCVFAYNFHPAETHKAYALALPVGVELDTDLLVALDTNELRFGGGGVRIPNPVQAKRSLSITLPPRTGLVLAPAKARQALAADPLMQGPVDKVLERNLGA